MPRKPTIQPQPLKIIKTSEFEIELIDFLTRNISRGSDKMFIAQETAEKIVICLIDDLQSSNAKRITNDRMALSNNSRIATYMALLGYELDQRTLRRYGSKIRPFFERCIQAQEKYCPEKSIRYILRPHK